MRILPVLAVLALVGCPDEAEDLSISEVTIYNIPAQIPVMTETGPSTTDFNNTFKIYINASDYQEEDKPPKACGLLKLTDDMKQGNGTYTVTIPLKNPIPDFEGDPNEAGEGDFYGRSNFASIMIVPQNVVADKENAIWIKGSAGGLYKSTANIDWTDFRTLTDFRSNAPGLSSFDFPAKTQALYDAIVCKDKDITSK